MNKEAKSRHNRSAHARRKKDRSGENKNYAREPVVFAILKPREWIEGPEDDAGLKEILERRPA